MRRHYHTPFFIPAMFYLCTKCTVSSFIHFKYKCFWERYWLQVSNFSYSRWFSTSFEVIQFELFLQDLWLPSGVDGLIIHSDVLSQHWWTDTSKMLQLYLECLLVIELIRFILPAKVREYVFTGVGLSVCVCLSVTTITKRIVDGFVSNFMGRFLLGIYKGWKRRPSSCFVTISRWKWSNGQILQMASEPSVEFDRYFTSLYWS